MGSFVKLAQMLVLQNWGELCGCNPGTPTNKFSDTYSDKVT